MLMNKKCTKCKIEKEANLKNYYSTTQLKSGLKSWCRECTNKDNRERESRSKIKWSSSRKNGSLKRDYGITLLMYNEMLLNQNGKCKICQSISPNRRTDKYFSVDHCHKTGEVRGLLCSPCNTIVGLVERSLDIKITLQELKIYLEI